MAILEERGRFWWTDERVPDGQFAPDGSITGLLTIDNDGHISLELDDYFPNEHGPFGVLTVQGVTFKKNICGVLKASSRRILLIGVIGSGGATRTASMSYQRFVATDCLVGDSSLYKVAPPIRFSSMEIDLSGFAAWFWFRSIKVSRTEDQIATEWKRPEPAVYDVDGGTLLFEFNVKGSIPYGTQADEIALKEYALVRFALGKSETLEQGKDRFKYFEDLLILLVDTEYRMAWPMITLEGEIKAQWYFARFKGTPATEPPELHECLTYFPHLRASLGAIWAKWAKKREQFGPGFYLYLGTRRGLSLYPEHRFVNLIWGIEAFHRMKSASSANTTRIEAIIGQIADKEDKKLVRRCIKYAHEPSLEQRIFSAFKDLPIGLDSKRLRSFARACAKARNDISHFGSHRDDGSYSDFALDLEKKSRALSELYHCLLLQEIGIRNEMLMKWIYHSFMGFRVKYSFVEVGLLDKKVLETHAPEQSQ
jgi:ApeA-like protein/HEPN superfamily Apea-like protein